MKVCVIAANTSSYPDPVYPLGAAYAASAAQRAGHTVSTFDCCFHDDFAPPLKTHLQKHRPAVIGISLRNVDNVSYPVSHSFLDHYRKLIEVCRECADARIVLGGSALTLYTREYQNELKPDVCIAGEGDVAFVEVLARYTGHHEVPPIYRAKKLHLPKEHLIPSREFFPVEMYVKRGGTINIQTKRGCGFSCSFCTFPYLEGTGVRCRDPREVVDELDQCVDRYGTREFFFVDSVFNFPEEHARAVCEEIVRRKVRIFFTCYMRPQSTDQALFSIMKRAGCVAVEVGTESMSLPVLQEMNKQLSLDDIFSFCEACNRARIPFCHGIIFGMPAETPETVRETVRNVEKTKPTAAIAVVGVRLYKNTSLYHSLQKNDPAIVSADTLRPVSYCAPAISSWIGPYLKELVASGSRWIVPGFSGVEPELIVNLRARGKRGPAWLYKQLEHYL